MIHSNVIETNITNHFKEIRLNRDSVLKKLFLTVNSLSCTRLIILALIINLQLCAFVTMFMTMYNPPFFYPLLI